MPPHHFCLHQNSCVKDCPLPKPQRALIVRFFPEGNASPTKIVRFFPEGNASPTKIVQTMSENVMRKQDCPEIVHCPSHKQHEGRLCFPKWKIVQIGRNANKNFDLMRQWQTKATKGVKRCLSGSTCTVSASQPSHPASNLSINATISATRSMPGPGQQSLQGPNEVAAFGAKTAPKAAAILGRFLRHADRFLTSQTAQRDAAAGTTISAGAATTSVHPESARSARKHTQGPPADGSREAVITSVGAQNRQISS
jgi:hypothetical protein